MLPDGADRWNVARPWTVWTATLRNFVSLDHKETLHVLGRKHEYHPNWFRKMAGSRVRDKRGTRRKVRGREAREQFPLWPSSELTWRDSDSTDR